MNIGKLLSDWALLSDELEESNIKVRSVVIESYPSVEDFMANRDAIKLLFFGALSEEEQIVLNQNTLRKKDVDSKANNKKRKVIVAKLLRWYYRLGSTVYGSLFSEHISPSKSTKSIEKEDEIVGEDTNVNVEKVEKANKKSTKKKRQAKVVDESENESDASSTVSGVNATFWKYIDKVKDDVKLRFGLDITVSIIPQDDSDEDDGDYADSLPVVPTSEISMEYLQQRFQKLNS